MRTGPGPAGGSARALRRHTGRVEPDPADAAHTVAPSDGAARPAHAARPTGQHRRLVAAVIGAAAVLAALGLDADQVRNSLRFGLGRFNTVDEIDYAVEAISAAVRLLRGPVHLD